MGHRHVSRPPADAAPHPDTPAANPTPDTQTYTRARERTHVNAHTHTFTTAPFRRMQIEPSAPGSAKSSWEVALPSAAEQWHWAFYSCNGLHDPADYKASKGVQPLWADLLRQHEAKPFHALVGGESCHACPSMRRCARMYVCLSTRGSAPGMWGHARPARTHPDRPGLAWLHATMPFVGKGGDFLGSQQGSSLSHGRATRGG